MDVGISLGFGNPGEHLSDADMYRKEAALAVRAEELGFDTVWAVEHHFTNYAMCPNNIQFLTWLAGQTERVKLGTAAVILPWHDPLRVAEEMITLDVLSNGRALFGMGRGLSRKEYRPFRADLGESRERFDEAAAMIKSALATGVMAGEGPFYKQPEVELRPRPIASFDDRIYSVSMSRSSIPSIVELRTRLYAILQVSVENTMPIFTDYRDQWRAAHNEEAPPVGIAIALYCHRDSDYAKKRSAEIMTKAFYDNAAHYELAGEHFGQTAGYQSYAEMSAQIREVGLEAAADGFVASPIVGSPDEVIDRITEIKDVLGDFELTIIPRIGECTFEETEDSLELFAEEVLPIIKKLD